MINENSIQTGTPYNNVVDVIVAATSLLPLDGEWTRLILGKMPFDFHHVESFSIQMSLGSYSLYPAEERTLFSQFGYDIATALKLRHIKLHTHLQRKGIMTEVLTRLKSKFPIIVLEDCNEPMTILARKLGFVKEAHNTTYYYKRKLYVVQSLVDEEGRLIEYYHKTP